MIHHLPGYVSVTFGLTTILTLFIFFHAARRASSPLVRNRSNALLAILIVWLIIQALITLQGVYSADTESFPPKILLLGIVPAIVVIVLLFTTSSGRRFIDSLPIATLTYLNVIRIPVEVVLFWLFLNKLVPQLMTFEGRNFDILAGITAPFVAYFAVQKNMNRKLVLAWNFICLALLLNIVINALLAVPSPIQKWAFDQPNIAILNFPFSWLPTFVVPVVLFGHLASIRQLLRFKESES